MSYSVKLKFELSPKGKLRGEKEAYEFLLLGKYPAKFCSIEKISFSKSIFFELLSSGFNTEDEVLSVALSLKKSILAAGVFYSFGVRFGGHLQKAEKIEYPIFHENSGFRVFKSNVIFIEDFVNARGVKDPIDIQTFITNLNMLSRVKPSEQHETSVKLFHSSFFQNSMETKFLALITAIESLLPEQKRSEEEVNFIDDCIESLKKSNIQNNNSLLDALNSIKNKSIGSKLRDYASIYLNDKKYGDKSSKKFISDCYNLRSVLLHTGTVENDNDFSKLTGELQLYASDLLKKIIIDG